MSEDLENQVAPEAKPAVAPQPTEETWTPPTTAEVGDKGFGKMVLKRSGVETDIEFPVNPPAIIGRFDPAFGPIDVDLAGLPEGSYISRKHAKITCDDNVWSIHDLGSSNGTFVLEDKESGPDFVREETATLADGTEFALGNARFVFHLTSASAVEAPEEIPAEALS